MKLVWLALLFVSNVMCGKWLDLDIGMQEYIIQARRIQIPDFEGAFNPSIVPFGENFLMSFRVRDKAMVSTFDIGLVLLDRECKLISSPQILQIRNDSSTFKKHQDPRLLKLKDVVYIVFSNTIMLDDIVAPRMFIAPLKNENGFFFIDSPVCLHPFEGETKRWEKNWVPFEYKDELFLAYSLLPHRIFKPLQTGECLLGDLTYSLINWQWGELRGGTPAVKIDEGYLAFFHSSRVMATEQSQGKKIQHYFIGAYVFSKVPPFAIQKISPDPLIHKTFYNGPMYNTWKPLRVVFPMGLVVDENYIWLVYGRQDHEIWIAQIDKIALLNSLVDCVPISDKEGALLIYQQKQMFKVFDDNNFQNMNEQVLNEYYESYT